LLLAHDIEIKVLTLLTNTSLPVVKIVVVVLTGAYTAIGVLSITAFDD
jgi:hypothetical protein